MPGAVMVHDRNEGEEDGRAARREGAKATEAADLESRVRVLCVDDHAVLVKGLIRQFAVEDRIRVVGRLASAERLLEESGRLLPDLVILDIEMSGPDVFEMAVGLGCERPGMRFVFLSVHVKDGCLAAAYKCGAWGYLSKRDELADIEAGIHELMESRSGTLVMGPKVRRRCVDRKEGECVRVEARVSRPRTHFDSLTAREIEILHLIGKGCRGWGLRGRCHGASRRLTGITSG